LERHFSSWNNDFQAFALHLSMGCLQCARQARKDGVFTNKNHEFLYSLFKIYNHPLYTLLAWPPAISFVVHDSVWPCPMK
jgi:hypothetical protein